MTTAKTLLMLSFPMLAAANARAQQSAPQIRPETLTIVRSGSQAEVPLVLINTGKRVTVVGGALRTLADTTRVMTPVQLILPLERFRLAVSAAESQSAAEVIVHSTAPANDKHPGAFATTLYTPFAFTRANEQEALQFTASKLKSERVP